ncbi:MAG: hypothetical protein HGA19_12940 [Oscillochloris sp.]|nr:hypothetical protein [Oscillochloris sp.]
MVYLTDLMTGVRVFDLTDPTAPITDAVINISKAITIAASANVAYVVVQDDTSTSKLYTLNLSSPATPTLSSPVPNFQSSYLDYQDDLLITSEGDEALRLSDLTDPLIPNPLGAIPLISNVTGVAANGYLEMLKGYKTLVAADIRHPAAPQIIQTDIPMTSTTSQTAITAAGDYMLLGTVAESWRVLDVSDPSQPQVLSSISLGQNIVPFAAALDETQTPRLAYLISGCGYGTNCSSATELAIYNLSDPANPQKLSTQTLTSNGTLLNLVVRDGYLYLTFYDSTAISASVGGGRLAIYDVRNYGTANLVGSVTFEGGPSNLAVTDGLVYVVAGTYGIHAIDVSDPTTPQVLSTALGNLGVAFSGIAADGPIVYASTLYSGELFTLDMRDSTQPILVNQRVMPGGGKSLLLVDDQLIALGDGLTLYRRGGTRAGHVRDLRGAPVPNVKLNLATSSTLGLDASTSSWVATDIGGNFSSDLPLTGAITLTPQFYDTAFWPANRTVTSDSSARDFTLVAPPVTTSVVAGQVRTLVITDTQGLSSTLSLPADALANATSITVQEQGVGDTGGLVVAGHAFAVSLAGSGAHFTQPATLKLHYSRGDVRMISDLSALKLYRQTDTGWVAADVNCTGASAAIHDQTTRQIQVAICDSGLYALLGPTERVFIPVIAH